MLSYIVALVAGLIFLANPISQIFFPRDEQSRFQRRGSSHRLSPRPKLNESLLAIDLANATAPDCPPDAYIARILSRAPLVVYLENFLSEDERRHLLEISEPLFVPSTITHDARTSSRDTTVRDSSVALIPRTDTVRCIERRSQAFQGYRRDVWTERLRTQRYESPSGHYAHHYDWSRNNAGWGRVSSFMVWVDDDEGKVEGGGTEFPLLEGKFDDEQGKKWWCSVVECDEDAQGEKKADDTTTKDGEQYDEEEVGSKGTTFKVIPGNAVYWENFAPHGRGYEETWHAGLPVKKGTKVGLNIWNFGRIE